MCICSAATVTLFEEAEENATELTVFHTDFCFGLNSGYSGILVVEMSRIRVPPKIEPYVLVKMVSTRPSTADIQAIQQI